MREPWREGALIEPVAFARLRRRMIFDCFKWDPQTRDLATLSPVPMVLRRGAWDELRSAAEALFVEALACERELIERPDLLRPLALSARIRRALADARRHGPSADGPRVMRFDFHATPGGWRLSEVNADVPGGYIEASGFSALAADLCARTRPAGDPATAVSRALRRRIGDRGKVALVHATAYADDAQVMRFLGTRLAASGLRPLAASPSHLRWRGGRARIDTDWHRDDVQAVVRFFPAEWLQSLPGRAALPYFAGSETPHTNPGSAVLVQSKRFPLVWSRLRTAVPTWRRFLPRTVDPRDARTDEEEWVLKPALGRVGEGVGIPGVTDASAWRGIRLRARVFPSSWVAQRRFAALPWSTPAGVFYPCIGVFVVDGQAAGAYGRMAARPLIDERAMDVAVLVDDDAVETPGEESPRSMGAA